MGKSIKDYVDTCDTCCQSKPARGKPHDQLKPNEIPDGPGQIVTCDYIVGLPLVDGYNSIQIMVDHHRKLAHLMPCNEEIDAEGTVHIFICEQFRLHGLSHKIISDHVLTAVCLRAITMAYVELCGV